MTNNGNKITIQTAALVAGIAILGSVVAAPFAEMYVFPKLIVPYKTLETASNIIAHKGLFVAAMYAYLITFILDLIITWALYILLRPVNKELSLLTASFRLVYTIIALVALNNLVTAFRLLDTKEYLSIFNKDQLDAQVMVYLRAFKNHWYFGIIFFAVHLIMLGYLVFKSKYIPKVLGIILAITGLGYFLTTIRPFLFPGVNVDFAMFTFFGEIIFMIWLLVKWKKIRETI